ncbi:dihydrofolate reductase [[Candida] anglica]|uniref:Dihydrofolate reductase n=1 Tax=[Candida] anglica TaxID=148631 RepID=A0ABP0ENL7_9ASCO
MKSPSIVIIVAALLPELGIGFKGTLPWKLRQEMKYFRTVTSLTQSATNQNAVIMGRKTWESIPSKFRPLPNRLNVILSRSHTKDEIADTENTILASSLDEALLKLQDQNIDKIYIIGGAELYNSILNDQRLTHVLLTEISALNDLPPMDRFFKFDTTGKTWERNSTQDLLEFVGDKENTKLQLSDTPIEENDYSYRYTLWTRK